MVSRRRQNRHHSRRALLRATAGALGAGTAALAGCMSTLPPLGRRVRYGRVDTPQRQEPVYGDWLPAPGELEHASDDHVDPLSTAMYTTPGNLGRTTIGTDLSLGASLLRSRLDYLGVGFENFEWALGLGPGIVLAGDVPVDTVDETLTGSVYEPAGEHLDFELYRRRDRDRVVAVSGTHLVCGFGDLAVETVRTVAEVGRGRRDRAVDADDDAALFVDAVGASPFTWYEPDVLGLDSPDGQDAGPIAEPVASAHSYLFTGRAMFFLSDALFQPGEVPPRAAVRDVLESQSRALQSGGVDITRTDRLLTVEMRIDAVDVNTDASQLVVPQVTWSADSDPATGILTVTHHAGDPVDVGSLRVQFDDGPASDRLEPTTETIEPGDEFTVDASGRETDRVRIYTSTADDRRQSILFTTRLDDSSDDSATDATDSPEDDQDEHS